MHFSGYNETQRSFGKGGATGNSQEDGRFILSLLMQQYDLLNQQLIDTEARMLQICNLHYKQQLQLLQTIPGIKQQSAMQIISETGGDMEAFESSKIVGWAGLRPGNDESAGKIKSTKITLWWLKTPMIKQAGLSNTARYCKHTDISE